MSDRQTILSLLKSEFEPKGFYVNGGDWICCQSCAWAQIRMMEEFENAVFWHEQDDERAFDIRGNLVDDLYLAWSGNGQEIVDCLKKAGYDIEWDKSEDTRIMICATTSGECLADVRRREEQEAEEEEERWRERMGYNDYDEEDEADENDEDGE